jgi:hypothetical protein
MNSQPKLVLDSDQREPRSGCVCVHNLHPDLVSILHGCAQSGSLLQPILRVRIVKPEALGEEGLPDVFGRYQVMENGLKFIPYFPFERDVKYRAVFDPRPLGVSLTAEPLDLEFLIPPEQEARSLTTVTHIFPSCDVLPENSLRFYVCFSRSMQRGRALDQISLLDSDGRPVEDALYRPPVELWDRTMRHLTVLLDPGRLKRWVGPNVELGPPLRIGREYTLEIGSGMLDLYGRSLCERFRKPFLVGDPVREPIAVKSWKILTPMTGSRQALVLMFTTPLDWALLLQTITIESVDGAFIDGQVVIDQCERRWSFTPTSPWAPGAYRIRVGSSLEDVCGNNITGPFERPLRSEPHLITELNGSSLIFQLI